MTHKAVLQSLIDCQIHPQCQRVQHRILLGAKARTDAIELRGSLLQVWHAPKAIAAVMTIKL
jgi:hypothetical protein